MLQYGIYYNTIYFNLAAWWVTPPRRCDHHHARPFRGTRKAKSAEDSRGQEVGAFHDVQWVVVSSRQVKKVTDEKQNEKTQWMPGGNLNFLGYKEVTRLEQFEANLALVFGARFKGLPCVTEFLLAH